jgi:hypothetical protein
MAIVFEANGTLAENAAASTTLNVPYPATVNAGDVLVLWVACANPNQPTTPGSFVEQIVSKAVTASPCQIIATRVADGSESGSLAVTTPSATSRGMILRFSGVDNTTPVDDTPTEIERGSGNTNYNIPAQTASTTGCAIVYAGCVNTTSGTWTPPTTPDTFTEVSDDASPNPKGSIGYLIWSGSGSTGTINLVSSTSTRGGAAAIMLRPAAGDFNGSATLSGTGSVSTSGTVGKVAGATIAGTGSISAAGSVGTTGPSAGATVSGTGSTTSAGRVGKVSGASLAGTGSITASGVLGRRTGAVLSGTGAVTSAGVVGRSSGATVSGTGAVTASGDIGLPATAGVDISAVGLVMASGSIEAHKFTPPTYEVGMNTPIHPLNYFRLTTAATVVRRDGTFISLKSPSADILYASGEQGVDWFRGGITYDISAETAAELEAAGYETF